MKKTPLSNLAFILITVFSLNLVTSPSLADKAQNPRNYDARINYNAGFEAKPQESQTVALKTKKGHYNVTFDKPTGITRTLQKQVGYLSAPQPGDPMDIAIAFATQNIDLLGLIPSDIVNLEQTDRVFSKITGATRLYLRQTHAGLAVYNGQLQVNVNRDGRIISVNNMLQPALANTVTNIKPNLTAIDAIMSAAQQVSIERDPKPVIISQNESAKNTTIIHSKTYSTENIKAELMWLPIRKDEVRLVWRFQLKTSDQLHHWDFTVDALSAKVWTRFDWVAQASYRVFQQPIESPDHSLMPPPSDGRELVIDPQDLSRSPLGWHNDGTTIFDIPRGNNVHAFNDANGDNQPPFMEPDCGVKLNCDFLSPIDFGVAEPEDYIEASVTNLFYWVNIVHDIQYGYGFDEEAGNFQANNLTEAGTGGDAITAFNQKGGSPCPNNAFFGTPPDGSPPTMIMCLWTNSTPKRDFSWDTGVMIHEIGHGISNRLIGGPSNVSCLNNTQQAGEGFGDWWALAYTHELGDQGTDIRGAGTYILGQPTNGGGVRSQPYSTDPLVNNFTYESINGASLPHGLGTVWAQVTWEVYWALVNKHGFDPDLYNAMGGSGNQRMMLYVNEGMKNTTCAPAFTDLRDGILQAATDSFSGEDVCTIWQAFANFGLGSDAVSGGPNSTNPTDGFQVPQMCLVDLIFSNSFDLN